MATDHRVTSLSLGLLPEEAAVDKADESKHEADDAHLNSPEPLELLLVVNNTANTIHDSCDREEEPHGCMAHHNSDADLAVHIAHNNHDCAAHCGDSVNL